MKEEITTFAMAACDHALKACCAVNVTTSAMQTWAGLTPGNLAC
jgi:hypothetical protein